jgi:hypothetical protein
MKKYVVDLSEDEQERLKELTTRGKSGARKIRRARILLLADERMLQREGNAWERERNDAGEDGGLALHGGGCTHEAGAPLPGRIIVVEY